MKFELVSDLVASRGEMRRNLLVDSVYVLILVGFAAARRVVMLCINHGCHV